MTISLPTGFPRRPHPHRVGVSGDAVERSGDFFYDPGVGSGKTSAVFIDYLALMNGDSLSEEEQMRRALLHFVPGITDAQIQDAINCGFSPAESARFVEDGWPDSAALDVLLALRDDPNAQRPKPRPSAGLHFYLGDPLVSGATVRSGQ